MKILVLRVSSIGDVIHTLPSIFLIKNCFPNAKLSWVVQKKAACLLEQQPFLENIWQLPDNFLAPKNWIKTIRVIKELRKTKWDAILDFQGLPKTSILSFFLKGTKFGFDFNNAKLGITSLFNNFKTKPIYTNIIQKNLALTSSMLHYKHPQIKTCPTLNTLQKSFYLETPLNKKQLVVAWLTQNKIQNFITLVPNTTWQSKHWPEENWKQLIKLLCKDDIFLKTYSILLIGKDFGDQAKEIELFIQKEKFPVHIVPNWDLITTTCLISKAKLTIAPDTGFLHIADFVGTNTIGIFGPTKAVKHGPFFIKENIQNVIQIECPHNYMKKHGKTMHNKQKSSMLSNCMYKLSPESLFNKILKTLI